MSSNDDAGCGYYDSRYQICCNGRVYIRPMIAACCGVIPYDKRYQKCCDGIINWSAFTSHDACCNGKTFDFNTQLCCSGTVVQKAPNMECCGTKTFDSLKAKCCNETVIFDSKC